MPVVGAPPLELPVEERLRPPTLPAAMGEVLLAVAPEWTLDLTGTGDSTAPFVAGGLAAAIGLSDRTELSLRAAGVRWWTPGWDEGPDVGLAVTVRDGARWDFAPGVVVPFRPTPGPPFGELLAPAGLALDLRNRLVPGGGRVYVDLGHGLAEVATLGSGLDTPPGEYDFTFTFAGSVGFQALDVVAVALDLTAMRLESYGTSAPGRDWGIGPLPFGVGVQVTPAPVAWGDLVIRYVTDDLLDSVDFRQRLELIGTVRTSFRAR